MTSGVWKVTSVHSVEASIHAGNPSNPVAICINHGREQNQANARAIATLPNLLAAIRFVLDEWSADDLSADAMAVLAELYARATGEDLPRLS